jgi:hypothetical protein
MDTPILLSFVLAIAVLLIGIIFAIANKRLQLADQATFMALFIIPLVVLGVASGKVQEFSAPGGLGAKFSYTAGAEIKDVPLEPAEATLIFKGDEIPDLKTARLARAIVLTLGPRTKPHKPYTPEQVSSHIDRLGQFQWSLAIAIVDKTNHFVATAEPDRFQLYLNNQKSERNTDNCQGLPGVDF